MFFDLAIAWDPFRRRCDLAIAERGLAIDTTPVTPVLISLGSDRRAEPDDALPDTVTEGSVAAGINPRRGWAGDALNPDGRRIGSRLWLLEREKQTEDVRLQAQAFGAEACDWIGEREGVAIAVAASWPTRTAMLFEVGVGDAAVSLQVPA